jgi:glyoxylase-like metal-dependent hydrolase (beta-lactamase superfamily II)
VARPLSEGDEVAGFRVIHALGHAPGEVIFFRDSDRVAICGDVVRRAAPAGPGVIPTSAL